MSKYEKLWEAIARSGGDERELTFDQIAEIGGVPIDHSFLNCKKELIPLGWEVDHVFLKRKMVRFKRTPLP